VTFLTPRLLARMHATEGAYLLCRLSGVCLHLGASLESRRCARRSPARHALWVGSAALTLTMGLRSAPEMQSTPELLRCGFVPWPVVSHLHVVRPMRFLPPSLSCNIIMFRPCSLLQRLATCLTRSAALPRAPDAPAAALTCRPALPGRSRRPAHAHRRPLLRSSTEGALSRDAAQGWDAQRRAAELDQPVQPPGRHAAPAAGRGRQRQPGRHPGARAGRLPRQHPGAGSLRGCCNCTLSLQVFRLPCSKARELCAARRQRPRRFMSPEFVSKCSLAQACACQVTLIS